MLEGVLVVRHIIIIVVRIGEEGITVGEDIRSAQIRSRQLCLVGSLMVNTSLALYARFLPSL